MLFLFLISIIGLAIASPPNEDHLLERAATSTACQKASARCTGSANLKQVSAYCSARLHISTITSTVAKSTVTKLPSCHPPKTVSGLSTFGFDSRHAADAQFKAAATPAPKPSCFGASAPVKSCECFSLSTSTVVETIATATVTGPFAVAVSKTPFSGYQGQLAQYEADQKGDGVYFGTRFPGYASLLQIDQNGYLQSAANEDLYAFLEFNSYQNSSAVIFGTPAIQGKYPRITCHIQEHVCALRCKYKDYTSNQICYPEQIFWSLNNGRSHCAGFTPLVDPDPYK